MLGLSKTSIFRRVLQHGVRNNQQFNKAVKVTMQQKLLQHCIIVSCIILTMLPSSLPRHPREEAKPGTKKYKIQFVVVGSGFSIKRPVTVDTTIDRINLPCRGALIITTARSDLPGGVHLVREHPTEAIRYAGVHPSSSTKRPSAGLILSTKELWTLVLCTPARCVAGR